MYPNLRLLSLLGIFSLILINFTGCGEKRVHVATVSGAPGDELVLDPMTGNIEAQPTPGLESALIDESGLSSQTPDSEATPMEPIAALSDSEPINMAHDSTNNANETLTPQIEDTLSPADSSEPITAVQEPGTPEIEDSLPTLPTLNDGQNFSAQSNSMAENQVNPLATTLDNLQDPAPTQLSDSMNDPSSVAPSTGVQDLFIEEGLEPIPDTFQIAKAEPSDGLLDRMNQLKKEELAAAVAGLEDVFFQFDSWTLTEEGKHTLQRTLKWFEQEPTSNLIIEGHADQRGTQAYNMVLAKKRAVAVQEYLSQLGVDASRLEVISYGKDKPFCQDATEVCYQLNRRGHLLIPAR